MSKSKITLEIWHQCWSLHSLSDLYLFKRKTCKFITSHVHHNGKITPLMVHVSLASQVMFTFCLFLQWWPRCHCHSTVWHFFDMFSKKNLTTLMVFTVYTSHLITTRNVLEVESYNLKGSISTPSFFSSATKKKDHWSFQVDNEVHIYLNLFYLYRSRKGGEPCHKTGSVWHCLSS